MKNFFLLFLFFWLTLTSARSQLLPNIRNLPPQETRSFQASWIRHPGIMDGTFAVVLFRKTFILDKKPESFIIHISADNRYRLFVNGKYASEGPAKSDLAHWYYETIDLAPLLQAGENLLAAEVVNFGPKRTFSRMSAHTDFFVMGHSEAESVVNTTPGSWKTMLNPAHFVRTVDWIGRKDVAFGLYVANPTDSIVADKYPWGWEQRGYNDSEWEPVAWSNNAGGRNTQYAGGINLSGGKLLVPRPIDQLQERQVSFARIAREEGINVPEGFLDGKTVFEIPGNRKVRILIDQTWLTVGFPEMIVSGGKGSVISAGYAETLYEKDLQSKGNRNELTGKSFIGIRDFFVADGGSSRLFRPLSHRAFRFIQLDISTKDDPLVIQSYIHKYTAYPLELKAEFTCDNPKLNQLMIPGWRTASICAQDILLSDAYYEQMQYLGDSKIHNLALLCLSGNEDLIRNQLKQTDWSRIPEGLTLACYPNAFHLVIPFYSLTWIEMIHDYMMWSGDLDFISGFDLGIYNVLEWFHDRVQENGLLGPIAWWNDVDWSPGFPNGVPPGIENGNSALFSLAYVIALQQAADISRYINRPDRAENYEKRASDMLKAVKTLCYDTKRGLFAETPSFSDYSQHTNILAILAGAVNDQESRDLMRKVLKDRSLNQVALFFRYYLLEALFRTGLMEAFMDELDPWFDMIDMGLTTFTEIPPTWESQRSDCHPWSTSPNIHFFTSVCGIRPAEPGFAKFTIRPQFGALKQIRASFPAPTGDIRISLDRKESKVSGTITLEEGMSGSFIWGGKTLMLQPGENTIDF